MSLGVGIVGAGPGAAALHVPTLALLPDDVRIVHVAHNGGARGPELADQLGARVSVGVDALWADPEVDIVVLSARGEEHPALIRGAIEAGIRTILCEKPLAVTAAEAHAVIEASRVACVNLVIGTNHQHDPTSQREQLRLRASPAPIRAASVLASLPPNDRYHDLVSEGVRVPERPRPVREAVDAVRRAAGLRRLLLGLGIHDVPLLRHILPGAVEVDWAEPLHPLGYDIALRIGGVPVNLVVLITAGGADACWDVDIVSEDQTVRLSFPPAFLHAGPATAEIRTGDGISRPSVDVEDGYLAEWHEVLSQHRGERSPDYDSILADALLAVEIADAVSAHVLQERQT